MMGDGGAPADYSLGALDLMCVRVRERMSIYARRGGLILEFLGKACS